MTATEQACEHCGRTKKYCGKRAKLGSNDRNEQLGEMFQELQDECHKVLESTVPDAEEREAGKVLRRNAAVAAARALGHLKEAWTLLREAHGPT